MEGLLDFVLRDILTRVGGVDRCVAEFIRITDQLLPARVFTRVVPELLHGSRTFAGTPVRPQFLGSDPSCLADNAACIAQLNPAGLDLNFGCPAKIVNRHGGGAALLQDPDLLFRIAQAVRAALPETLPLSAKMRLGYEDDALAVACAEALVAGGVQELAVHGRTKVQAYTPPAYWHRIADVRAAVKVPVIANGEIWTLADARMARQQSQCTPLMLGRGLVADPGLARAIQADVTQAEAKHQEAFAFPPTQGLCFHAPSGGVQWHDLQAQLPAFWHLVQSHIERRAQAGRLKQWLNFMRRRFPEAQVLFDVVKQETDPIRVGMLIACE
jgi:tRNA-dihydrouridine synthase C